LKKNNEEHPTHINIIQVKRSSFFIVKYFVYNKFKAITYSNCSFNDLKKHIYKLLI